MHVLLGIYLVGFVVVAATFRRPLLAVFWPAAALLLLCAVLVIGIDLGESARD